MKGIVRTSHVVSLTGHANAGSQAGLGQASLRPTRFFMFSMRGRDTFSLPATSRTQVARAHRNIRGTRKCAASTYPHSPPHLPRLLRRAGAKRAAQALRDLLLPLPLPLRPPPPHTPHTPDQHPHANPRVASCTRHRFAAADHRPQSQPWTPRAFVTASRPRSTPTLPSASKRSSTSSMCVCPCPCPCPCAPRGCPTDRATGRGAARLHRWSAERAAAGAGARHPPVK